MKATTESNFDRLPWDNEGGFIAPSNDALIAKVKALHADMENIKPGYRRELVVNAINKIQRYRRNPIALQFSHNETIMLERMYARLDGAR